MLQRQDHIGVHGLVDGFVLAAVHHGSGHPIDMKIHHQRSLPKVPMLCRTNSLMDRYQLLQHYIEHGPGQKHTSNKKQTTRVQKTTFGFAPKPSSPRLEFGEKRMGRSSMGWVAVLDGANAASLNPGSHHSFCELLEAWITIVTSSCPG